MKRGSYVVSLAASWFVGGVVCAHAPSPVSVEIVDAQGQVFREFPVNARDGALRSYLQAEKGARYQVRIRNTTGQRLGLVIAVDGRNIINGAKSDLTPSEPMYVLDAYASQDYAGWRANLEAINEFYFTDWADSYAEAFGDRSARGVIAVAAYRELLPVSERRAEAASAPAAPKSDASRDKSAGTGYGDRRIDQAREIEFATESIPDGRHFIKYEWHETLCRKHVLECGEKNRFWDESTLGFAPPPPRRH